MASSYWYPMQLSRYILSPGQPQCLVNFCSFTDGKPRNMSNPIPQKNVFYPGEAAEVVNLAKMFVLDDSNYSLVGSGGQAKIATVSD